MPKRKRHRKRSENEASDLVNQAGPAGDYARFKARQQIEKTEVGRFAAGFDFPLDDFQLQGAKALEAGESVLVAAPTGAGKTIVGEFALQLALSRGQRVFYTTPIKALSNQKFKEFTHKHGADQVGLLTGDVSINGQAPIVVMTTEVLRNMLYTQKPLDDLAFVVLDEVHYLADRFRGPVWEEVILHLPASVQLVCLSATVSNAEEFGSWLGQVRGDTRVIVSEERPVPLWQQMMVGKRLFDLYPTGRVDSSIGPERSNFRRINPELEASFKEAALGQGRDMRPRGRRGDFGRGRYHQNRLRPAPRPVVIEKLRKAHLLPAIYFIFSRAACDDALFDALRSGICLTTAAQAEEIDQYLDQAFESLPASDYAALNLDAFRAAVTRGFAAHHAGLLPLLKEVVEHLFQAGLVQVVFATETLALGINMPARTVVLENLVKWDGAEHVLLTPGQYTQLTGRAGRRGIDVEGHAVVLAREGITPKQVGALASRRSYPLRSAFVPTYNMVANLLARYSPQDAKKILEQSFAQYQADRNVVGYVKEIRTLEHRLAKFKKKSQCELGDVGEFMALRQRLSEQEKLVAKKARQGAQAYARQSLAALERGDLIAYEAGRRLHFGVVVTPAAPLQADPTVEVVTNSARQKFLNAQTAPQGVQKIGRKRLGPDFSARSAKDRAQVQSALKAAGKNFVKSGVDHRASADVLTLNELRAELRNHPVGKCPKLESHIAALREPFAWQRQIDKLQEKIASSQSSLGADFERITSLLKDLGYLSDDYELNSWGQMLARLHAERDLLVAQVLRHRLLAELNPIEAAGFIAACVYEPRGDSVGVAPPLVSLPLSKALNRAQELAAELAHLEAHYQLDPSLPIDPSLIASVIAWAQGEDLSTCLELSQLPSGDFVRWMKRTIDLAQHIEEALGPELATQIKSVNGLLNRGVVAWSGI
ncbi:DEAD/DEAH box helicase [Boudabousia liubingyangii]|uniref:DEAD/DEAH box helicase n=1 Tax=Boudabousia liubingyangii TaxID=1921764 RepID=UPI0009FAB92A|nr:DEAD/DEAH box helicase [Boudabousia liubingyangii]